MPRPRRAWVRRTYVVLAALLSLLMLLGFVRFQRTAQSTSAVVAQLRFLREELHADLGPQMQQLFPEGYFFSHVLYGLTWTDVARRTPTLEAEALREARWALHRLDSAQGRAPFSSTLRPAYGIFYAGWSARLRGAVVELAGPRAPETARLRAECRAIARALKSSMNSGAGPFLQAYPGQAWPVDSVVAVAALRLHDKVTSQPRFGGVVERWIETARDRLDPATGLLRHQSRPFRQGARGSSQAMIQRFLPEIDTAWAGQQYAGFREQFVTTRLGLPGVLEYPKGQVGKGDVDSGPLLLGVSASATVVAIGPARIHRDSGVAGPLTALGEVLGMPIGLGSTKRYALGALPIGDAFLAWSAAATPSDPPGSSYPTVVSWWWRLPWYGVGVLLLGLIWLPALWSHLRDGRPGAARSRPPGHTALVPE